MKTKTPLLAAVLNVLLPGVGYLYLGVRKAFGWLLVLVTALYIIGYFADPVFAGANDELLTNPFGVLMGLAAAAAFGVDAWQTAKERGASPKNA